MQRGKEPSLDHPLYGVIPQWKMYHDSVPSCYICRNASHGLGSYTFERGWMKSHVLLLSRVLEDTGIRCCTSTVRDLKTITNRVEHEGLSFLAITLPEFGKAFERSLDQSQVSLDSFKAFKALKGSCLPAFLQGFTSQVFDSSSGRLLDEPCTDSIQAVRQICFLFKRFEAECTDLRYRKAFKGFIECDNEVAVWNSSDNVEDLVVDFARASYAVFGEVLHNVNQVVYEGRILPNHGPGATADRLKANAKWTNRIWTERLEDAGFYAGEFLYPSWSHFLEDEIGVTWLEPEAEIPVRVVSVPKTLKTPRIIAIEPTHMQYVQQGIKDELVSAIEGSSLGIVVGFRDQTRNNDLARQGSVSGDLATLDLSEASDRVSNLLVRAMFAQTPHLHDAVDACRSRRADVPGHGIHTLAKFASMGSALTFPVEAMVFTTLAFMGISRKLNRPLDSGLIKRYREKVRVYGDDIIVPVEMVRSVVECLETYGLKVNSDKSFWTGKFRESCGKEYYDGIDVSIVKLKTALPTQRKHAHEIVSTVAFRNHMYYGGYWRTAEYLDRGLERIIPFPIVEQTSQALGRHSHLGYQAERECPILQRPLVRAAVVDTTLPRSPLGESSALLKFFLTRLERREDPRIPSFAEEPVVRSLDALFREPPLRKDHLLRAGRPEAVNIKLRWVSPY